MVQPQGFRIRQAIADGVFSVPDEHFCGAFEFGGDLGGANIGHAFNVDGTDERSVTDALITHEVAARQRGSAVLGAAGGKLTHTMTLPLLTGGSNPGLIQPGYLIEVNDIGHTWRGLVRGIRISAGLPTVRQTITVEREAVTP